MQNRFEGKFNNGKDLGSERNRSSGILGKVKKRRAFSMIAPMTDGFQYGTEPSYAVYNNLVIEIPLYLLQAFFTFHQDTRTCW